MIFTRISKPRKILIRIVSLIVIQSFIISNVAFAAPDVKPASAPKPEEITTDPSKIVIPSDTGLIKSRFTGRGDKLIIHIQDAHCNYEAQTNIARILENLIKNYSLSLVSVEGADGFIDTSWFKAFPDDDVRKEVANYFMKKGEITGPEFLSITTDYPLKLFGAETRSYYIQNLNAFTSSYPYKDAVEKYLNEIRAVLAKLKNYIYTEDLKNMDSKKQEYDSKKAQFNDYVRFLESMAERQRINIRQYDNLFKLISVLIYEKKIDFSVTDKERNTLIDELSKAMSKERLTELVAKSLAFKVGKISSVEYYDYIKSLAKENDIDLVKRFPNLANYIIYNTVYSRIENEKLFNDIKALETAIKEKLFRNEDQRTLDKLSYHIDILIGLVNIKLLNADFAYFESHKAEFTHDAFASFINAKAAQYGLLCEIEPPAEAVAASIPKLEDFYSIAIKRDKALIDNTIGAMKKEKVKIAVLVTGGFHSEGIAKLLEKEGVSYMVVCPSITKDMPSPYIQILTNQRTSFEEILMDTGAGAGAGRPEAKQGMLAPFLIAEAVPMYFRGDDRALNEISKGAKDRAENVIKGWARRYAREWYGRVEAARKKGDIPGFYKGLASDADIMKKAFELALDKRLGDLKEKGVSFNKGSVKRAVLKYAEPALEEIVAAGRPTEAIEESAVRRLSASGETRTPGTSALRSIIEYHVVLTAEEAAAVNSVIGELIRRAKAEGPTSRLWQCIDMGNNRFCDVFDDLAFDRAVVEYNSNPNNPVRIPLDIECHPGTHGTRARYDPQRPATYNEVEKHSYLRRSIYEGLTPEERQAVSSHEAMHIKVSLGATTYIPTDRKTEEEWVNDQDGCDVRPFLNKVTAIRQRKLLDSALAFVAEGVREDSAETLMLSLALGIEALLNIDEVVLHMKKVAEAALKAGNKEDADRLIKSSEALVRRANFVLVRVLDTMYDIYDDSDDKGKIERLYKKALRLLNARYPLRVKNWLPRALQSPDMTERAKEFFNLKLRDWLKPAVVNPEEIQAVVMAGGGGTRLFPLSTEEQPKQLLSIIDGQPLVVIAIKRLMQSGILAKNIYVQTVPELADKIFELIKKAGIGMRREQIFVEPKEGRPTWDTAAAVAYSAVKLKKMGKGRVPTFYVTADHIIGRVEEDFTPNYTKAASAVRDSPVIGIIGIIEKAPSREYGQIKEGDVGLSEGLFTVRRFKEKAKTDPEAQQFYDEGYLFNSGMFMGTPETFLRAFRELAPVYYEGIARIEEALGTPQEERIVREFYEQIVRWKSQKRVPHPTRTIEGTSVDYVIAEALGADEAPDIGLFMIKGTFPWLDIGSFRVIYEYHSEHASQRLDEHNNLIIAPLGMVVELDPETCKNSLIIISDVPPAMQGKIKVTLNLRGLDGMTVVYNPITGALLVAPRDVSGDDIRKVIGLIQNKSARWEHFLTGRMEGSEELYRSTVFRAEEDSVRLFSYHRGRALSYESHNSEVYSDDGLVVLMGCKNVIVLQHRNPDTETMEISIDSGIADGEVRVRIAELKEDALQKVKGLTREERIEIALKEPLPSPITIEKYANMFGLDPEADRTKIVSELVDIFIAKAVNENDLNKRIEFIKSHKIMLSAYFIENIIRWLNASEPDSRTRTNIISFCRMVKQYSDNDDARRIADGEVEFLLRGDLGTTIDPDIYRRDSIRAMDADRELTDGVAEAAGAAYVRLVARLRGKDPSKIVIAMGRESRPSGRRVLDANIRGALLAGATVYDCTNGGAELTSTPVMYFASRYLEDGRLDGIIEITASHLGKAAQGEKPTLGANNFTAEEMQLWLEETHDVIDAGMPQGAGTIKAVSILEAYHILLAAALEGSDEWLGYVDDVWAGRKTLREAVDLIRPRAQRYMSERPLQDLRLAADSGFGSMGPIIGPILADLGAACEDIGGVADYAQAKKDANPNNPDNLRKGLVQKVAEFLAILGMGFDVDGDRLGVVTRDGRILRGDDIACIIAPVVIRSAIEKAEREGKKGYRPIIAVNVLCSERLKEVIIRAGGIPIESAVGFNKVKEVMIKPWEEYLKQYPEMRGHEEITEDQTAEMGVEISSHIMFKENFNADDAFFAVMKLIGVLMSEANAYRARGEDVPENLLDVMMDSVDRGLGITGDYHTGEWRTPMNSNQERIEVAAKIGEYYERMATEQPERYRIRNKIDGIKVEFLRDGKIIGWLAVRPAGTSPEIVVSVNSLVSEYDFNLIKNDFFAQLSLYISAVRVDKLEPAVYGEQFKNFTEGSPLLTEGPRASASGREIGDTDRLIEEAVSEGRRLERDTQKLRDLWSIENRPFEIIGTPAEPAQLMSIDQLVLIIEEGGEFLVTPEGALVFTADALTQYAFTHNLQALRASSFAQRQSSSGRASEDRSASGNVISEELVVWEGTRYYLGETAIDILRASEQQKVAYVTPQGKKAGTLRMNDAVSRVEKKGEAVYLYERKRESTRGSTWELMITFLPAAAVSLRKQVEEEKGLPQSEDVIKGAERRYYVGPTAADLLRILPRRYTSLRYLPISGETPRRLEPLPLVISRLGKSASYGIAANPKGELLIAELPKPAARQSASGMAVEQDVTEAAEQVIQEMLSRGEHPRLYPAYKEVKSRGAAISAARKYVETQINGLGEQLEEAQRNLERASRYEVGDADRIYAEREVAVNGIQRALETQRAILAHLEAMASRASARGQDIAEAAEGLIEMMLNRGTNPQLYPAYRGVKTRVAAISAAIKYVQTQISAEGGLEDRLEKAQGYLRHLALSEVGDADRTYAEQEKLITSIQQELGTQRAILAHLEAMASRASASGREIGDTDRLIEEAVNEGRRLERDTQRLRDLWSIEGRRFEIIGTPAEPVQIMSIDQLVLIIEEGGEFLVTPEGVLVFTADALTQYAFTHSLQALRASSFAQRQSSSDRASEDRSASGNVISEELIIWNGTRYYLGETARDMLQASEQRTVAYVTPDGKKPTEFRLGAAIARIGANDEAVYIHAPTRALMLTFLPAAASRLRSQQEEEKSLPQSEEVIVDRNSGRRYYVGRTADDFIRILPRRYHTLRYLSASEETPRKVESLALAIRRLESTGYGITTNPRTGELLIAELPKPAGRQSASGKAFNAIDFANNIIAAYPMVPEDIEANPAAQEGLKQYIRAILLKDFGTTGERIEERIVESVYSEVLRTVAERRLQSRLQPQFRTAVFLAALTLPAGVEINPTAVDQKTGAIINPTSIHYRDRGWHDTTYMRQRGLVIPELVINERELAKRQYETVYSMNHGYTEIPPVLLNRFGEAARIHDTYFPQRSPLYPGTIQYQTTGAHYQAGAFDIKYCTAGRGLQYLVKFNEKGEVVDSIIQEMEVGKWVYALPGYVDIVVNLGDLRFTDVSYELSAEEAESLGIDMSRAAADFYESLKAKGMAHVFYEAGGMTHIALNPEAKFEGKLSLRFAEAGVPGMEKAFVTENLLRVYMDRPTLIMGMMTPDFLNRVKREIERGRAQTPEEVSALEANAAREKARLGEERRKSASGRAEREFPNPADVDAEHRVVVLISGGESAGVNDYFARLAKQLAAEGYSLEVVRFGLDGLVQSTEEFAKRRIWINAAKAAEILGMPGAVEGTARVKLTDVNIPAVIQNLKGYCKTLVMIGGNDHLGEAAKLAARFKAEPGMEDMVVVALPKTIDRDTLVYPIGALTAGEKVRNLVRRAVALPGSNKCVVTQVMGRDMGYLTVAAAEGIGPTAVVLTPEWSVKENGEVVVSLEMVKNAVEARMRKYGAANVIVSEGFRISANDELLKKVLRRNPLLAARYSNVKYDAKGNPQLGEIGVADFIAEALDIEMEELSLGESLLVEIPAYSFRSTEPNETDRLIAESAINAAIPLITTAEGRAGVIRQGGACIAAERSLKRGPSVRVWEFSEVTNPEKPEEGKVNLAHVGFYTPDELRAIGVLGLIGPREGLRELTEAEKKPRPEGANLEVAVEALGAQGESSVDMTRPNVCVIARPNADELIEAATLRAPISRADEYILSRTRGGTVYITSKTKDDKGMVISLSEIAELALRQFGASGSLNLVVSANLTIKENDILLQQLLHYREGEEFATEAERTEAESVRAITAALISAARREGEYLVFGRQLADLLVLSLTYGKNMKGVRKNVLGEVLNLLPGEEAKTTLVTIDQRLLAAIIVEAKRIIATYFPLGDSVLAEDRFADFIANRATVESIPTLLRALEEVKALSSNETQLGILTRAISRVIAEKETEKARAELEAEERLSASGEVNEELLANILTAAGPYVDTGTVYPTSPALRQLGVMNETELERILGTVGLESLPTIANMIGEIEKWKTEHEWGKDYLSDRRLERVETIARRTFMILEMFGKGEIGGITAEIVSEEGIYRFVLNSSRLQPEYSIDVRFFMELLASVKSAEVLKEAIERLTRQRSYVESVERENKHMEGALGRYEGLLRVLEAKKKELEGETAMLPPVSEEGAERALTEKVVAVARAAATPNAAEIFEQFLSEMITLPVAPANPIPALKKAKEALSAAPEFAVSPAESRMSAVLEKTINRITQEKERASEAAARRLSTSGRAGEASELTVMTESAKAEVAALARTLGEIGAFIASGSLTELDDGVIVIGYDTDITDMNADLTAQLCGRLIDKSLGDRIIVVRAPGAKLADNIQTEISKQKKKVLAAVTIASTATVKAEGERLKGLGKVIDVKGEGRNGEKLYVPVAGLHGVALRIAVAEILYKDAQTGEYNQEGIGWIRQGLGTIAINADNNEPFTDEEVKRMLSSGILRVLPRIQPVDTENIRKAHEAAQAALKSL